MKKTNTSISIDDELFDMILNDKLINRKIERNWNQYMYHRLHSKLLLSQNKKELEKLEKIKFKFFRRG